MNLAMQQIEKNETWLKIRDFFYHSLRQQNEEAENHITEKGILVQGSSHLGHCGPCCDRAQKWLLLMARSYDFSIADASESFAPAWLPAQFNWGPTQWPITWCKAVRAKAIDCGVFAAFAHKIFEEKGFEIYRAQTMLRLNESFNRHLQIKWGNISKKIEWMGDQTFYHEMVALIKDGTLQLFDPTEGTWVPADFVSGHGSLAALKVESAKTFYWGQYQVGQGQWTIL